MKYYILSLLNLFVLVGCKSEGWRSQDYLDLKSEQETNYSIKEIIEGESSCEAIERESWILCKKRLINEEINKIKVSGDILCVNTECSIDIRNRKKIHIEGHSATFIRKGGFSKPLFQFGNITDLSISGLEVDEPTNIPIQMTPKSQEINEICKDEAKGCSSTIQIYDSQYVSLEKIKIINGKVFNLWLVNNEQLVLTDSVINSAFLFGIWGKLNKFIYFKNNFFELNRSNAILMDTSKTELIHIENNTFNRNHFATAFHVCGNGTEPCPGGQIDLVQSVKNATIVNNYFTNGGLANEFPEDSNYNWITAIEFEPHSEILENILIQGNEFRNHSGSPFFINSPTNRSNLDITSNFIFEKNKVCNMKTLHYSDPQSQYSSSAIVLGNVNFCETENSNKKPIQSENSTELETVLVNLNQKDENQSVSESPSDYEKSDKIIPSQSLKLNNLGQGCDDKKCIWLTGENFKSGCTVTIYSSDWSYMLATEIPAICESNLVTIRLPNNVLKHSQFHVLVVNPDLNWSNPLSIKLKF
jgi:hypothetical protein